MAWYTSSILNLSIPVAVSRTFTMWLMEYLLCDPATPVKVQLPSEA